MSDPFMTPELAWQRLDEKIASIDPNRTYQTTAGPVTGAQMRAMMERTVRYMGVDLPPREAR